MLKLKKQNILHVITTLELGGAELLLINMIKYFNYEKYNIYICFLFKNGTALYEMELPHNCQVINLSNKGKFSIFSIFSLISIIQKHKIDIIHTHLVHAGIIGKIAAKITRVKNVVSTRHYKSAIKEKSVLYRLENILSKKSKAVIAISDSVKEHLIKINNIPENKVQVIYNGIDIDRIDKIVKDTANEINNDKVIIGTIGRLHPIKGIDVLLNAFKMILDNHPNTYLELIGDGEIRSNLESQSKTLRINENVNFLGQLLPQDTIKRLNTWDVFVLSSLSEGFGIVIIEAMALSKPVVASKVGGVLGIVEDKITGYFVQPQNPIELSEKILNLIYNPYNRKAMGILGRKRIEKKFNITRTVSEYEMLYENILKPKD